VSASRASLTKGTGNLQVWAQSKNAQSFEPIASASLAPGWSMTFGLANEPLLKHRITNNMHTRASLFNYILRSHKIVERKYRRVHGTYYS